jgi:hypothetical protein
MVDNPNTALHAAIAGQHIISTITLHVSATDNPVPGGGTANTAFLRGGPQGSNAVAASVTAMFWLKKLQGQTAPTQLLAAASPRQRRSCNGPSSSRSIQRDEPSARWLRRRQASRPVRSTQRSSWRPRPRPDRSTSSSAPRSTWCAAASRSPRVHSAMLRRCS